MSKFGSLSAPVDAPHRVALIDPTTDKPLVDTNGGAAYIDVLSSQSGVGREYDREHSQAAIRRAARGSSNDGDQFAANVAKLARLTRGWYLVDPVTKEPLNVPFTTEVAVEFYSAPLAFPFFQQAFMAAHEVANFLPSVAKSSSQPPNTNSATDGS